LSDELARLEYELAGRITTEPVQRMRIAKANYAERLRARAWDAELGPGANVYNDATGRWTWTPGAVAEPHTGRAFELHEVDARRAISSSGAKRGKVKELVIT
jgi:hypothetical protein